MKTLVAGIVRYVRLRGLNKVALITATDAMGELTDRYELDAFALPENKPLTVVLHEGFNPSDINVAAQIARIRSSAPDVIFAWATGPAFGNLLRSFSDAGLNVPVATSGGNSNPAQLKQYAAYLPPELLFAGLPEDLTPEQLGTSPIRRPLDDYRRAFAAAGLTLTGIEPVRVGLRGDRAVGMASRYGKSVRAAS